MQPGAPRRPAGGSTSCPPCSSPRAGPAQGLTSLWSPGYEPQTTRKRAGDTKRATESRVKTRRPGPRPWGLGLTVSRTDPAKHAGYRSHLITSSHLITPRDQGEVGTQQVTQPTQTALREAGDIPCPSRAQGGGHEGSSLPKASCPAPPRSHLLAVRGHEVEAAGGDGQGDGHAGKLQVALAQDGVQGAAAGLGADGSMGKGLPGPDTAWLGGTGQVLPPSTVQTGTSSPSPLLLSSAGPSRSGRSEPQAAQPGHSQLGWDPALGPVPRRPSVLPPSSSPAQPHLPPPHGSLGTRHGLAHQPNGLPAGSTAGCQSPPVPALPVPS